MNMQETSRFVLMQNPRAFADLCFQEGQDINYNPYPLNDPRYAVFQHQMQIRWFEAELAPRVGEP